MEIVRRAELTRVSSPSFLSHKIFPPAFYECQQLVSQNPHQTFWLGTGSGRYNRLPPALLRLLPPCNTILASSTLALQPWRHTCWLIDNVSNSICSLMLTGQHNFLACNRLHPARLHTLWSVIGCFSTTDDLQTDWLRPLFDGKRTVLRLASADLVSGSLRRNGCRPHGRSAECFQGQFSLSAEHVFYANW